jgi:hypothetical protein
MEPMMNHPDESADMAMIQEKIVPIILTLAERLESVESRLADCETMITKIVTGVKGAATNQQKLRLGERVRSEYGPQLDPIKPIYQKLVGEDKDPVTDIVEAVMALKDQEGYSPDMDADYVKDLVNQILGRFGLDSLRSLIEPAVEQVVEGGEPASLEIEVASGEVPAQEEPDMLAELREAKKRSPKIRL